MSTSDDPRGPRPVPPADELDELASALHDGEATREEAARAGEPDVAARVAAFARVTEAVGAPVPPVDDAARDRAVAAAVAAWGTASADDRPVVDELARRRQRTAAWLRPLGIAAAVVAAVAIGGVALRSTDGDTDDAASDAASESTTAADGEAGTESGAALAIEAPVDLGPFATLDELAAAVDRDVASRAAAVEDADDSAGAGTGGSDDTDEQGADVDAEESAPASPPVGSVYGAVGCQPPEGAVGAPARATLEERPVVAYVVDDGSGRRVVVLDEADCSVVGERPSSG